MQALILAGGEGKRLKPLTNSIPKILLPICNKPALHHLISSLKKQEIVERVILSLGNLADKVLSYLSRYDSPLPIEVKVEKEPLDTGGAIKFSAPSGEDFIVINGDIISDVDYNSMLSFHKAKRAHLTILTVKVKDVSPFGRLLFDGDFRVKGFLEKTGEKRAGFVNGAIYIMGREILSYFPEGKCSLERDVFPLLVKRKNFKVYAFLHLGYWMDIGERERYIQLHKDILDFHFPLEYYSFPPHLDEGTIINQPSLFGEKCIIRKGARIFPYSVLGNYVEVGERAEVRESILLDGVSVGEGCKVYRSIIGEGCSLPAGSVIQEEIVS
ncbi:MAG: sugar phosphate nucleotidyltransferase [bacterium]